MRVVSSRHIHFWEAETAKDKLRQENKDFVRTEWSDVEKAYEVSYELILTGESKKHEEGKARTNDLYATDNSRPMYWDADRSAWINDSFEETTFEDDAFTTIFGGGERE